jgi:hypothetical protein
MITHRIALVRRLTLLAVGTLALHALADTGSQKTFPRTADAMRALANAARTDDKAALLAILGPGSDELVSSGDPVDDRARGVRFAAQVAERTTFETMPSGAVVAHIGKDGWPFPIPLVKDGDAWRFDTAAGRDELLNRRIGSNELKAIDVSKVYVTAQREYARQSPDHVYAEKVRSDPGKRDGLYWEDSDGTSTSPFGPLVAEAAAGGYEPSPQPGSGPRPFHGYVFRILTAQGASAPGGARSYVKDGKMSDGFGLLAYPADYGSSGIMTFIVGPDGIVFQKNLGDKTAEVAKAITTYDPDDSWAPVRD